MASIKRCWTSSKGVEILMFCGNCTHLNFNEVKQNRLKKIQKFIPDHIFLKYNKRVRHLGHEPNLLRLDICVKDNSKEDKIEEVSWYSCPNCGQKLCRIDINSKAEKIYLWCKKCKKEVEINI